VKVNEQGRGGGVALLREPVSSRLEVAVEDPLEGFFDGQEPFLVALADHLQPAFTRAAVEGAEVQREELSEAAAGEQVGGDVRQIPLRPRIPRPPPLTGKSNRGPQEPGILSVVSLGVDLWTHHHPG
jgi:hypothetical protein